MAELRIVITTLPESVAASVVETLVEEQLAACGNLVAARSIYRWRGEMCREPETLVVMETAATQAAALLARLETLHPYECPKILVLVPDQVNAAYLAWAEACTRAR